MRSVLLVVVLLGLAFAGALAVQVLMAQSKEEGSFSDRVASVMQRQLGLGESAETAAATDAMMEAAPEPPPAAGMQSRSYSLAPGAAPSPPRLSDLTIPELQELLRSSTRAELDGLARRLEEEAAARDQDGFWTDVRLNMLFMLLSFALPVAFARMRRA